MATHIHSIRTAATALLLSTALGCQWNAIRSNTGAADTDATFLPGSVRGDSLSALIDEQRLEIARRDAQIANNEDRIRVLNEEIVTLKSDLEYVERQFVLFERRLTSEETKASAVAAVAEVRLLMDKMLSSADARPDTAAIREADDKLRTAASLVEKQNYSAAAYYASRAMRVLNTGERRAAQAGGDALIIAVSRANMRRGPGSQFDTVEQLAYGSAVFESGRDGDWVHVRTPDGREGWIHRSLLR